MQPAHWQKIEEIFYQAVALPENERQSFVAENCDDDELCREIMALLSEDSQDADFLNEPVYSAGLQLIGSDYADLFGMEDFGHYKLLKLLGRGGMGAVFLAEDTTLERLTALKILPPEIAEKTDAAARFRQEAKAASAISHPNVAHIYEFSEAGGRYFLAMEYVAGKTLRELLKENAVNQTEAFDITLQIAEALSATHKRGVIHRDIKPENVIVTENGLVKVLDFGLAKLNAPPEQDGKILASLETTPGLIIGTTAYMSPEQVRGQPLDARTDLWSLGVLMFEMLSGARPFTGQTLSDIQAAILLKDAPLLALPTDLAIITGKLLKKNAAERYQTTDEFLSDLRLIKTTTAETGFSPAATPKITQPETKTKKNIFSLRDKFLKIILAVALFTGAAFSSIYFSDDISRAFRRDTTPGQNQNQKLKSLVVLPFRNETENEQIDFLSEGLAEDVTRSLGKLNAFRVISFSSARQLRDVSDIGEIKNRVDSDAVLRGAVKRENNRISILVELIKTDSGEILWQDAVQTGDDDLLKLRNALTDLLSTNVQNLFGNERKLILSEYSTRSEAAYRAYLAGKYSTDRNDAAGTKRAVQSLERAVALDPNYAQAYTALAESYNLLGAWFGEKPKFYLPKAKAAVEKAIALDKTSAEAHTILAKMKMDNDRDWAGTEVEFKRAIELNSNYSLAHHWFGEVYLSAMGRFDESIRELETAHALDPLSSNILTGLAWSYIGRKDYEKAIIECQKALALNPKRSDGYAYLAMAQMKLGRFDEALENAKRANEIDENLSLLGAVYAAAGNNAEAGKILAKIKEKYMNGETSAYNVAVVEGALGNKDNAFARLKKDFTKTSADLLSMRIDPLLDNLRDDARFDVLEAQFNFPPSSQNEEARMK